MFYAHIPKLDSSASCFIQSRTLAQCTATRCITTATRPRRKSGQNCLLLAMQRGQWRDVNGDQYAPSAASDDRGARAEAASGTHEELVGGCKDSTSLKDTRAPVCSGRCGI